MKNYKVQINDPKRAEAFKLILKEMGFEENEKHIFSSKLQRIKK
jgi:hypothetical protein